MRKIFLAALLAFTSSFASAQQTTPTSIPGCVYNSTLPTLTNRQITPLQCDVNGKLITSGSGSGGITVGQPITGSCTNGFGIYNNAGVIGCQATAGAGTVTSISAGTGITLTPNPITTTGTVALASTIVAGGPTGSATVAPIVTYNAQGQLTTVSSATITPAVGSITGLGANVAAWLATPSSANLIAAVTDETGTGALVFGTSPTLASPAFTGTVTGANTIPLTILAQSAANTMLGNWTGSTANVVANAMPSCPDTGTNHLNYVSGTGITCGTAGGGGLTVGTTTIVSGTTTRILYDNAGTLGEYTITGTGTVVAMQTNPALVNPALGIATATSMAIGGATIGGNALAITGTTLHSSTITITQATAATGILVSTGGSNTGSNAASMVDMSWTLNTSGSPDVVAYRITDTARGASTRLLNIYGGASGTTSMFSVDRNGTLITNAGPQLGYRTASIWNVFTSDGTTPGFIYGGGWYALSGSSFLAGVGVSDATSLRLGGGGSFPMNLCWTSADAAGTCDVFMRRGGAAATLQFGNADAASPVAQAMRAQSVVAGTADTAGVSWTVRGSLSTGSALSGDYIIQTGASGAASTTQNAAAAGVTIKGGVGAGLSGSVVLGSAAIATNANDGFLYAVSGAGTPTGTPTTFTGRVPIYVDTTNNQLWLYLGGAWKQPKTPAGAALVTWQ